MGETEDTGGDWIARRRGEHGIALRHDMQRRRVVDHVPINFNRLLTSRALLRSHPVP